MQLVVPADDGLGERWTLNCNINLWRSASTHGNLESMKKADKPSIADGATGDASQLAGTAPDDGTMTSVQVVHAVEQPWERRRTQASLSM